MNRVGTSHDFILSTDAVYIGIQKSLIVVGQKEKHVKNKKSTRISPNIKSQHRVD